MFQPTVQIAGTSCLDKVIYGRFHDYPLLGGRTTTNQEEQSLRESKRKELLATEAIEQLAKDQVRRKAYLAREQAIEEAQKEKKTKRSEMHAGKEVEQLARDKARKETYLTQEKATSEAQEAKKIKAKKQSPE